MLTRVITLFRQRQNKSLAAQLIKNGIGTVLIRIANIFVTTTLAVLLATSLGPKGYGTYAYVIAISAVLAIPAQLGIPRLVIRETAKAQVSEEWGLMRGLWHWSKNFIISSSMALFCISALLVWNWREQISTSQLQSALAGLLLIPIGGLVAQRSAALKGLRLVVLGNIPELLLRPGILLLLLLSISFWSTMAVTPFHAITLHLIAAGLTLFIASVFLHDAQPSQLRHRPKPIYHRQAWLQATWPLALTAGMQQINQNADLLMLGYFLTAEDVGIYRVAAQGAMLVVFGQQAIAMLTPPYYARLYAEKDMKRLQQVVTASARIAFFSALPLVLTAVLFGKQIIGFIFGEEYQGALNPLIILGCGQLANAFFGHVGVLLNMTGNEKDTASAMFVAAIANITLNLILIPIFGMTGAAVSTAITLLVWNVILWNKVRQKLNIQSSALCIKTQREA